MDLLNYELYHTDSPTLANGAAIYITKTLKSLPRPDIKFNMQLVESCWAEIDPCNGKSPRNIEEFAKQLDDLIKKVQARIHTGFHRFTEIGQNFQNKKK